MIWSTVASRISSLPLSLRTTSRSLTIPSTELPSPLTTTAPMLCSASSASRSRTVESGVIVMTLLLDLPLITSLIFMA